MAGVIVNNSTRNIWITAANKKHCLKPREQSDTVGIADADGILLDGRPVLFDSSRTDLGGGQVYREGAIKVCDPGSMTVTDHPGPLAELRVEISIAGFICRPGGDPAGYKTPDWCRAHDGWNFSTAAVARPCT